MTRGEPRIQYDRICVLLPPDADTTWANAVVNGSWDVHRFTLTGSADDVGVGDLSNRRVVAVNPQNWDGDLKAFFQEHYPGVQYTPIVADTPEDLEEILRELDKSDPKPPQPEPPDEPIESGILYGLHDESGAIEMQRHGMYKGICLVHWQVQSTPIQYNFTYLSEPGMTVIARLNWGYAGTGTAPPPADSEQHIQALVQTILDSSGVDYWHCWNEPNNQGEHPSGFALTKEYITELYNKVWTRVKRVNSDIKLCLPPLDPYFGPGSNNMDWWKYLLRYSLGTDAILLHCKTQTNNPDEMWSEEKFSDWPLQWQYFQAKAIVPYIEALPTHMQKLPRFITEMNPQRRNDGQYGWEHSNTRWIEEAARFAEHCEVNGVVFYRWDAAGDQENFGLVNFPEIVEAIFKLP